MAEPTVNTIDETISAYSGAVPNRSTMDQATFDAAATAWADKQEDWPAEYNALASGINAHSTEVQAWVNYKRNEIDDIKTDAVAARLQAEAAQDAAEAARDTAQAASNFKGQWSSLSGAITVPASVYHEGQYWLLLSNLTNVSAHEPSDGSSYWANLQVLPIVRQPSPISPLNGATGQVASPTLSASAYANIYDSDARDYREFQIDVQGGDWSSPVYEFSGDVNEHELATPLDTVTSYQWHCRDVATSGETSAWSATQIFSTADIYVEAPTITTPTDGTTDVGETPTLTTSAFAVANGGSDTHLNTDWRIINNATLATVWESLADATNKTSIDMTAGVLQEATTYRLQARHRGTTYGESAWSTATTFTTADTFGGVIGTAGAQDFGVGIAPSVPSGMAEMTGTTTPGHDNYGNYETTNGSIMVFIPRFYYRIGSASSPHYATYGANAIDIAGTDTYADEAAANAAGYAMHRAFIDGGSVLDGFFIDKYLASKDGTTSCKSVADAHPISLTTNTSYEPSSTMTGCTGILPDAIVLARARGTGYHCASAFQYSALALLSLAHGQAATATTYCAWYDGSGTTNFPKGCNNNALSDTNDSSVTYTASYSTKPKTRATANFAKTTHNGQNCGVADLNGSLWQVLIGVTSPGANATDSAVISSGNAYVLKESVACADLTGGWNTGNDAWGDATHLATLYDSVTGLFPWGSATGWVYFGNSTNQVFDEATSGDGWLRTAAGIPQDTSATNATGTALFGQDSNYTYNRANLCPLGSGYWNDAAQAGVFARTWGGLRSNGHYHYGFRAARPAFGS
jgi:hypothetical protein